MSLRNWCLYVPLILCISILSESCKGGLFCRDCGEAYSNLKNKHYYSLEEAVNDCCDFLEKYSPKCCNTYYEVREDLYTKFQEIDAFLNDSDNDISEVFLTFETILNSIYGVENPYPSVKFLWDQVSLPYLQERIKEAVEEIDEEDVLEKIVIHAKHCVETDYCDKGFAPWHVTETQVDDIYLSNAYKEGSSWYKKCKAHVLVGIEDMLGIRSGVLGVEMIIIFSLDNTGGICGTVIDGSYYLRRGDMPWLL